MHKIASTQVTPNNLLAQVTYQMVQNKTIEIALEAGRSRLELRQRDYEQAKRELTGETDFNRQLSILYPNA